MPTQKKEESVKNIAAQLTQAKGVILADYQGLNTAELQGLREKFGDQKDSFQVVKNTLFQIGLKDAGYPEIELQGPTAAVFVAEDLFGALGILTQAEETPKIKTGFWEKETLDPDRLDQLTQIPNLKYLHGLVVGHLSAPLTNLVNALSWNLNQLVFTLKQIQERG